MIVPESAFRNGRNIVEVYQILEDTHGLLTLSHDKNFEAIAEESYVLQMKGEELLGVESSSGKVYSFSKGRFRIGTKVRKITGTNRNRRLGSGRKDKEHSLQISCI